MKKISVNSQKKKPSENTLSRFKFPPKLNSDIKKETK